MEYILYMIMQLLINSFLKYLQNSQGKFFSDFLLKRGTNKSGMRGGVGYFSMKVNERGMTVIQNRRVTTDLKFLALNYFRLKFPSKLSKGCWHS